MCAARLAKQNADVSPALVNPAFDLSSDVLPDVITVAAFCMYNVCGCMMYVYMLHANQDMHMYLRICIYNKSPRYLALLADSFRVMLARSYQCNLLEGIFDETAFQGNH